MLASVSLKSGWTTFWTAVSGSLGPVTTLMTVAGVLLVVGAIVKWMWDRRRGTQGQHSGLIWSMAIGAILASPDLLLPLLLGLVDAVINIVAGVFSNAGGN